MQGNLSSAAEHLDRARATLASVPVLSKQRNALETQLRALSTALTAEDHDQTAEQNAGSTEQG